MTEITQADRDAAAEAFFCKPLLSEKHNDDRRVRAFARHREQAAAEERAKIVAWLRGFATDKTDELADILEAGEPFTHPDNV